MNVSISAFYYYKSRKFKGPNKYDKSLEYLIQNIYHNNPTQGHRKTVLAYMNRMNLKVRRRKSNYTIPSGIKASSYYPNVVARNFKAQKINQKWSIDITYLPYGERRCYLFCIKDLYDKSIVDYKVSENMGMYFVLSTLKNAFIKNNIKPEELIVHSDQGVHFSALSYNKLLSEYGVIGSHSRRGNCLDNSPIESFFSLFKHEALWAEKPTTLESTKKCVSKYIKYYNCERYQVGLKEKTPHEIRFSA